jgi:hypothetical protein
MSTALDPASILQSLSDFKASTAVDDTTDIYVVLATLGVHLFPLNVINFHDLPQARQAVLDSLTCTCSQLSDRFIALAPNLQDVVTCGMIFSAECYPMPIYFGFGAAARQEWTWATECFEKETCQRLHASLAVLKETLERKEFWLLKKSPVGMDKITPRPTKWIKKERKDLEKAREELVTKLTKRGFPQPKDKSFSVNSWWIPFATWDSEFALFNEGQTFQRAVRWQCDPGRLLYAFIVNREINLREGELMLVPAGPAEVLVRWLEGLNGISLKVVPEGELEFQKLKLGSSARNTLQFMSRQDAYVIRDAKAVSNPFIAPVLSPVSSPCLPQSPQISQLETHRPLPANTAELPADVIMIPATKSPEGPGASTPQTSTPSASASQPTRSNTVISVDHPPPAYSKNPLENAQSSAKQVMQKSASTLRDWKGKSQEMLKGVS